MELPGQQKSGAKGEEKECHPGAFTYRLVERAGGFRVALQPAGQIGRTFEHPKDGKQADGHQGENFDQRFKGDRGHQPTVFFTGRDVSCAK